MKIKSIEYKEIVNNSPITFKLTDEDKDYTYKAKFVYDCKGWFVGMYIGANDTILTLLGFTTRDDIINYFNRVVGRQNVDETGLWPYIRGKRNMKKLLNTLLSDFGLTSKFSIITIRHKQSTNLNFKL